MNISEFYQSHKRCINQHLWFEIVARGKFDLESCGQAMAGQGSTPKWASWPMGTVDQIWTLSLQK